MHTKDKLAEALRAVGLDDMATRAESGWYHDYLSPLDFPETQLIHNLAVEAAATRSGEILVLRDRVINGEFDASDEESDEWAASPEGQEAFSMLVRDRKP